MNVQPISVRTNFSANNTVKPSANNTAVQPNTTAPKEKSKMKKALPYIAGAAIVAVSAYAFRNKISSILGKGVKETKPEHKEQEVKNTVEKVADTVKKETAPVTAEVKTAEKVTEPAATEVKTAEAKAPATPVADKPAEAPKETAPIVKEEAPQETKAVAKEEKKPAEVKKETANPLKGINLADKKVNAKLETIRKADQADTNRIIGENNHNGFIDIPTLNKVATDFMSDKTRGANRYHQAADLLEQTHVKAFINGDDKKIFGVDKFTENILNDKVLFDAYKKMPLKESATRLNNLKETALKSETYAGNTTADDFFNKAVAKLTEKDK